ncbi:MAG: 5-(carboxyamino)imidazole ribonucleotide mutase [Bdellovibrio sp.]|nr:MAG: 5-(carboxyamino)imidazole ribonucleotide mutase [Bdellovibrio sp.]
MKRIRQKPVAIIMGSSSDYRIMREAQQVLKDFKIKCDVEVVSAHRTPDRMVDFAKKAHERYSVIIAGAGGAAHLPGMVASFTRLPVIGVPVTVTKLKGLDALLSIAQMPTGVPVATVAVDNAANAGLLAARILAVENENLSERLERHARKLKNKVLAMNRKIKTRGRG